MNHARNLSRSILTLFDTSLLVSISRMESRNCKKKVILRFIIACRHICVGDTQNASFISSTISRKNTIYDGKDINCENRVCSL